MNEFVSQYVLTMYALLPQLVDVNQAFQ
jgi:hypothetical protein